MILPIIVVVVLVIAGGIAFVVKSKSSRTSGEFLSAEPARPAAAPMSTPPVAAPAAPTAVADAPEPDLERLVFDEPAVAAESAPAPVADEPVAPDERPEPMVRARIAPTAPEPAVVADPVDEDDDQAVLSRFKTPGARVASIPIPQPSANHPEPITDPAAAVPADDEPAAIEDAAPEPLPVVAEAEAAVVVEDDVVAEPEPVVVAEAEADPGAEALPEPEPEPLVAAEPEPLVVAEADPEPTVLVEPEAEIEAEVLVEAVGSLDADPITDGQDAAVSPAELVEVDAPAPAEAPPALTGAAAMSPVLDDPIVLTDEPPLPVAQLQPEPELDPVDHVLKALIHRAKEKQVGIAEVAAELVEQANLEDRDIDEVLADLVVRADDDTVDSSERLEELTLFNDSVPRRPGQLTDFDRLDKNARKKVIIRVLCLLVAMQEDNRLKPSEPRSEAETRHWPLARAVWPVPVAVDDEADDAEGDKKLPGRRLARTSTKR